MRFPLGTRRRQNLRSERANGRRLCRRSARSLALLLSLPALGAPAEVWTLGDCPSELAEKRAELERQLLSAEPGGDLYLPHPFPNGADEAVEDFLYTQRRIIDRQDGAVRSGDRRLFETLDAGRAHFVVSEVANWTPTRCGAREQTDFYFLIRVFDEESGEEITRAVIPESGHGFQLMHRPDNEADAAFAMTDLPELRLPASLAGASRAQYVTTTGPTLRCPALRPCVAFESGGRGYLFARDRLYRIDTEHPISFREQFGRPDARRAFLATLEGRPETLITLGGDRMAFAIPVEEQGRSNTSPR